MPEPESTSWARRGRIGHARINFTNLDLIFGHGAVHALIDALSFGPLLLRVFIYFSEIYERSTDPEKYKSDQNLSKKKKKTTWPTLYPFERAGHRSNTICSRH